MQIDFVRLANFRNIEFAEVALQDQSVWISGANAQGKTNLLEAISLLNALRSFRTAQLNSLIKFGAQKASLLFGITHEHFGNTQVEIEISQQEKKILIDSVLQKKLSDYIGKFPALALCSEDLQLLHRQPLQRRKFVDMLISSLDGDYLRALRNYHSALASRNSLLKENPRDVYLFEAFELEMAKSAHVITLKRHEYLERLSQIAKEKYALLASLNSEKADVKLKSDCEISSPEDYLKVLALERSKDMDRGSTSSGIHKDDFKILISEKPAKLYASEGQQRSIVLALKLAQYELVKDFLKIQPVILCDDVLGELDSVRRAAFWNCIDASAQVIATSTQPSPSDTLRSLWKFVKVENGGFF